VLELTVPLSLRGGTREFVVEELSWGKCVGWSAMVSPYRFTASGRATTDAVLFSFPRAGLAEACASRNDIGFQIMRNLVAVVGRRLHLAKAMWLAELQETVNKRFG
jgi:CRP-like cAMP-binding protein